MPQCEECKTQTNFRFGHKLGHCFCRKCYDKWREFQPNRRKYKHDFYLDNKLDYDKRREDRYKNKRNEVTAYRRKHDMELKIEALHILGDKCTCCGLSIWWVQTFDHIEPLLGKKRLGSRELYYYIINNPEQAKIEYQIHCFGCNISKNKYSKCIINHGELKSAN